MLHGLRDPALLQRILYEALDHSDDIIVILEQTGDGADDIVIASVNEAFCHTCGRSQQELIGRTLRSLVAPDADPSACDNVIAAVREHRSYRSEMLCARQGGATFWLGLHLMPVRDGNPLCGIILGPRHHRKPAGRRAAGSNPGPAGEGAPVRQGAGRHRDRQRHRPDDQSRPRPSGRISTSIVWYSGLPPSRRSPKSPPAGRCSSW